MGSILSTSLLLLRWGLPALALSTVAACSARSSSGGAQQPSAFPPPPPPVAPTANNNQAQGATTAPPTSIPEAQTQLDEAERDIRQRVAARTAPVPSATTPAPQPAAESKPPKQSEKSEEPSECALVCRALSSMRRAADTICRLDGDGSTRCSDARSRVARSVTLASQARCSCTE